MYYKQLNLFSNLFVFTFFLLCCCISCSHFLSTGIPVMAFFRAGFLVVTTVDNVWGNVCFEITTCSRGQSIVIVKKHPPVHHGCLQRVGCICKTRCTEHPTLPYIICHQPPHPSLHHSAPLLPCASAGKKLGNGLGSRKCRVWRRAGVNCQSLLRPGVPQLHREAQDL